MPDSDVFHLAVLEVPGGPDPFPSWALRGIQRADEERSLSLYGHTDLVDDADTALANYRNQKHTLKTYVLAVAGPADPYAAEGDGLPRLSPTDCGQHRPPSDVLGYGELLAPLDDNLRTAEVFVQVCARHRSRGIGTAVAGYLADAAARAGRTTQISYTAHPGAGDSSADVLVPPTGAGRIVADPSTRFAAARGFALEQIETHSQLTLPLHVDQLSTWRQRAQSVATDYEVLTWLDSTPAEWVADMAELHSRMSIDVPHGEIDLEEERWDDERVRDSDAQAILAGRTTFWAAARHHPSGRVTAYTQVQVPTRRTGFGYQQDTLVHGDHRGHRLGMLVKSANLQQLSEHRPDVQRIHTWNAGENDHMLAINAAMGFRPASYEALWQRVSDRKS